MSAEIMLEDGRVKAAQGEDKSGSRSICMTETDDAENGCGGETPRPGRRGR